jgi:hypothetical protein
MLNFSKKFIIDYALEDGTLIKKGFQYQMSDVGRLFHGKCVYWIYHGEKKYFVDKRLRIYDLSTSSEMGHFKVTNWTIFIRYKDKLVWQNQEFKFKQDRSDTTGSTWGHFKFLLTSETNSKLTYLR